MMERMQASSPIPLQFARELARAEFWVPRVIRVLVILAGAWVLTAVARRLLGRMQTYAARSLDRRGGVSSGDLEKRATTIVSALAKIVTAVVWILALVMALNELTFNIQPLLAGLGVAGIALGLGAQTLIKDWIGGVLILLEDQVRIGDAVVINGISGVVEEINLRTTVLRGESGAVHIIPNGSINTLSNLTREYAFAILETTLARGADGDKALDIIEQAAAEVAQDRDLKPWMLAPVEVLSVDRLALKGITIRARIKTLPGKQGFVGREWNRRANLGLEKAGIPFPPPM
jgi:moderate conductance mechanosensitive channel